jgi:predicted NAD-dependent protein-ADP-ribosyltransferase YbiA (DUF1768 family)
MDQINDYVFNHLPVQDVTNIVTTYNTSLFGFFKSEYTKYYNEEFKGSEEQHINYSFFKVLDKCKQYGGFTITITSNEVLQTLEEHEEKQKRHRNIERLIIGFEKKDKDIEENDSKYKEWKKKERDEIKKYNDTLKITISYEDSCVLYLTNTNWDKYKEEEQQYNNLLFIGPVTHIGENWLSACKNLINVDFRGLNNLQTVGDQWLFECDNLITIDFTGLNSLQEVGNEWLRLCGTLVTVDFTGLTSLEEVGDQWLFECDNLITIDFTGLNNLQEVGDNWLCACHSLVSVNFRGLSSLQQVGDMWLFECDNLITIDFTGLNNLQRVYDYWLCACHSLVSVNFRGLSSLQQVGDMWLFKCVSLVSVDVTGLTSLEEVNDYWLLNCYKLENVFIGETLSNDLKKKLPTYIQTVDSTIKSLPYNEFKFYNKKNRKHYLSNLYTVKDNPLIIKGEKWSNTDHYIQAMKFKGTPIMIEYSNIIKNSEKEFQDINKRYKLLKDLTHKNKNIRIRKDWHIASIAVIIDALYYKFNQYKSLKTEVYYGIKDNTYLVDGTKKNKFGKILTAFINVIKYGDCSKICKELKKKIRLM